MKELKLPDEVDLSFLVEEPILTGLTPMWKKGMEELTVLFLFLLFCSSNYLCFQSVPSVHEKVLESTWED